MPVIPNGRDIKNRMRLQGGRRMNEAEISPTLEKMFALFNATLSLEKEAE